MMALAPLSVPTTTRDRTRFAAAAAFATLALGLIAPPLALLALACAVAGVCVTRTALRTSWRDCIGPGAAIAAVGLTWGWDGAMGAVFAWRVIADARWSGREAQRLARTAGAPQDTRFGALHAWMTPALALAVAAHTAPHVLLGLPLDLPHLPWIAPALLGAATAFALFDWGVRRLAEWRLGGLAAAPAQHALAHHALFLGAYVFSGDLSAGLIAMIVWRLTQAPRLS